MSYRVFQGVLHPAVGSVYSGYSTSSDAGSRYGCIPDADYPPYWNDPKENYSDEYGNKFAGTTIQAYDLQQLCDCIRRTDAIFEGTPGTQTRVDACWNAGLTGFFGLVPGKKDGKDVWFRPKGVPYPTSKTSRTNWPNPCVSVKSDGSYPFLPGFRLPAPCSVADSFAAQDVSRGQATLLRVEKEPLNPSFHPVDSQTIDWGINSLSPSGDPTPGMDLEYATASPNISYLKELKSKRETARVQYPLAGLSSTIYESSLPGDATSKKTLAIFGVIGTAVALGGVVHLLTRKK